jgi:hypothetical protein
MRWRAVKSLRHLVAQQKLWCFNRLHLGSSIYVKPQRLPELKCMKRTTRIAVIILGILTGVLASAFAGGTVGFLQGYAHALGDTGVKAFTLSSALRAIRKGDLTAGISSLELELDSLIMSHWAAGQTNPSIFSWVVRVMGAQQHDKELFAPVISYRAEYPSTIPDPSVREVISSHLKAISAANEPAQ